MAMIGTSHERLAQQQADTQRADPNRRARTRAADGARQHSGSTGGWRRGARRAGLWLAVLATAAGIAIGFGYIRFGSGIVGHEPQAVPRTDAIVVVTGGSQRVGDAIGLLGAERGSRLLISGVNEKTGREELAKLNPSARELLACCVDLDYRARNTIGNAIEARRWQRKHRFASLLVVTSNYHMPRTIAESPMPCRASASCRIQS